MLIGGQGIVIDYPCANFGDFGLSRRADRHADRITEADRRYTDATTVNVSNIIQLTTASQVVTLNT